MGRAPKVTQRSKTTKRYFEAIAHTAANGTITPLTIIWENGRHFKADQMPDARQESFLKTDDAGIRLTIRVEQCRIYLRYERPRWFVEPREDHML